MKQLLNFGSKKQEKEEHNIGGHSAMCMCVLACEIIWDKAPRWSHLNAKEGTSSDMWQVSLVQPLLQFRHSSWLLELS